jgi:hypothetical protein
MKHFVMVAYHKENLISNNLMFTMKIISIIIITLIILFIITIIIHLISLLLTIKLGKK